jgi:metal-responsive CopG/Arc/MetJ family transcriptional regulator
VAKVMISLPDDLLARVDAHAEEHGRTRSGAIRELTEAALGTRERLLAATMRELEVEPGHHGGDVAAAVRAARPA